MIAATAAARTVSLTIDIVVQASPWRREPRSRATVRRAIRAAAAELGVSAASVSVMLADDAALCELNRHWRGQDKPTNVLSFPAPSRDDDATGLLGDIAIAYETLAREAENEEKPFLDHLAHLSIHGFLHLAGHDHEAEVEADAMEAAERKILAGLGIADPYR